MFGQEDVACEISQSMFYAVGVAWPLKSSYILWGKLFSLKHKPATLHTETSSLSPSPTRTWKVHHNLMLFLFFFPPPILLSSIPKTLTFSCQRKQLSPSFLTHTTPGLNSSDTTEIWLAECAGSEFQALSWAIHFCVYYSSSRALPCFTSYFCLTWNMGWHSHCQ